MRNVFLSTALQCSLLTNIGCTQSNKKLHCIASYSMVLKHLQMTKVVADIDGSIDDYYSSGISKLSRFVSL